MEPESSTTPQGLPGTDPQPVKSAQERDPRRALQTAEYHGWCLRQAVDSARARPDARKPR